MRIRRTFAFWLALAGCAATVLGAMTWLTRSVLAAERERLTAQRDRAVAEARADLEERTRLALWRMDALGAAIVLRENLVPAEFYSQRVPASESPVAEPEVLLHFQRDHMAEVLSPEADAAESLQRLQALWVAHPPGGEEWSMVEDSEATQTLPKLQELLPQSGDNALQRETVPNDQLRKDEIYQFNSNAVERNQRAKAVGQTVSGNLYKNADFAARDEAPVPTKESATDRSLATAKRTDREVASRSTVTKIDSATRGRSAQSSPVLTAGDGLMEGDAKFSFHSAPASAQSIMSANRSQKVKTGQMYATWLGGELFLIRQASRPIRSFPSNWDPGWNRHFNAPCIQGVWLDSRVLTANLLREVADLLPRARLVPAVDARSAADPLALVSFPFKLERGESPLATAISTIPGLGVPLWVAWGSVAFAFLTSALLVRGVLRLSERRASFVSAVTHELRTPLTTFRLYSDMLESGAVREEKRSSYLRVLSREADRLSHLVENVLAFSRIERGNARSMVREIPVGEMLESFRERFEARLTTAGMSLVMVPPLTRLIRVDTAVVEHILFNLIDNAAKYASSGSPRQVGIHVQESACGIDIRVEDHGPGIPVSERGRIFRAFHKSAREAAESQPGVGLGLSLSRRLARELGGQLECLDARTGACFSLKLPA